MMGKKKQPLMRRMMADVLEIPQDLALDLPRITLVGNLNLNVENHKGIISYSANEVRLRVSDGYLIATGRGFALRSISRTDVFLEGEIMALRIVLDSPGDDGELTDEELAELLREDENGADDEGDDDDVGMAGRLRGAAT